MRWRLLLTLGAQQALGAHHWVQRKHGEAPLPPDTTVLFIAISVALVVMAGLMSGLTLGLMSMDEVELEVLIRSGSVAERRHAATIMPLVRNQHFLLVTLLLCNALSMEALPLFLDRLADPVTAIIISVTAVLLFGEIIPQAICTRYGLAIGYYCVWLVRALMVLTAPLSWPISKLLDALLGAEHRALFRRGQLKALVDIHGAGEGLGGNLTEDEVKVICGALDLTSKTAERGMTPLSKAFMLPSSGHLDRETVRDVLESGHSRIPVYAGERTNIVGLFLTKELLAYPVSQETPISELRLRSLPRLPKQTPMYDMLKLFQTGRSHMVVLTDRAAPPGDAEGGSPAAAGTPANGHDAGPRLLETSSSSQAPWPEDALAEDQAAVGIITIEDVIEELMQAEIVDETDMFMDNERSIPINAQVLAANLPARLRAVLPELLPGTAGARLSMDVKRLGTAVVGLRVSKAQLHKQQALDGRGGGAPQGAAAAVPAAMNRRALPPGRAGASPELMQPFLGSGSV